LTQPSEQFRNLAGALGCEPTKDMTTFENVIKIECIVDKETRQEYIDSAVARDLPRVIKRKKRKGKVAIVGSGPSATDFVDMLKEWDGEIWGINRSFEWMRHRGIKPTGFLGIDPEWILKECIPNIPEDVTYYLAAQVHPCVFDHLKDRNVKLWFMADNEVTLPWYAYPIYGGSTCLSRAPNLAWALGYRDVHIFGGDSSYTHKTHVHGGELPENCIVAEACGRKFHTCKPMMSQAVEFVEQMAEWSLMTDPLSVNIYGDGLMQSIVAEALASDGYAQYITEQVEARQKEKRRA
jgi:hypothetical protein